MAELRIFIDESGDLGEITERPAYYLITMVFRNQSININENISKYKMLNFYNNSEIFHDTVIINRKEATYKLTLSGKLAKGITEMVRRHIEYFNQFDKVIVYYDNGQIELSSRHHACMVSA